MDCYIKKVDRKAKKKYITLSEDMLFCEGCGKMTNYVESVSIFPQSENLPPMPPVKPPKPPTPKMKTKYEVETCLKSWEKELANAEKDTHYSQHYIDFLETYILALKWVLNEGNEEDDKNARF
jgi:hypothetical protein